MEPSNTHIAQILNEIGILLQLKGENPFKVRAYEQAAHTIEMMEEPICNLVKEGRLAGIRGIGEALAEKITLLCTTGKLPYYEELKASIPSGLLECLDIPGVGPKKVHALYTQLHIKSIAELKKACEDGKVAELKGFGEKTQSQILTGIANRSAYASRHLRASVLPITETFLSFLKKISPTKAVECAGSFRRGLETVGDLDFIAASEHPTVLMDAFVKHPLASAISAHGDTKSSIRLESGLQVDLRVVPPAQYPFALHHFTGSKAHNIELRARALEKDLSLSEWGLRPAHQPEAPYETHHIHSEADLFQYLGLDFIPPELREGMGEISYAAHHTLPALIEASDIRGAFHVHTTASDGHHSLEAMAAAAEALGWEYLGIADHSKSSFQANGLSPERLEAQIQAIDQLNKSGRFKLKVFAGTECDILPDGRLDFEDSLLKQLDFVVASVHSSFTQDEETMTSRIIRALENPYVTMLGHITGRLLLKREAYKVNVPKVIDAAIANQKIIELNAHPLRLDMDWHFWRQAFDKDLLCSINPDAHSKDELIYTLQAIPTARKGFLTKTRVLNTRSLADIEKYLKNIKNCRVDDNRKLL